MGSMCRLVYRSAKRSDMGFREIKDILTIAQKNNREKGITGMLVMIQNAFYQVLEGPSDGVNKLFLGIASDKRHHTVRLIRYEMIHTRLFPDWSMRGVFINEALASKERMKMLLVKYGLLEGTLDFLDYYDILIDFLIDLSKEAGE